MQGPELYAAIIDKLPLLDSDRKSLREKRGFSDEVIDTMKFRSCGEFITHQPFVHERFFHNQSSEIFAALQRPNTVIPFLGPDGEIRCIRPHKFGIEGLPIEIYVPYPYLGADLSTVLVAESEFKALASCLMGVPAVGVPGIASVAKRRFKLLSDVLTALGCKKAIICFDNEIKDNPKFSNFKPDYTKRYDTQIYSYIMAKVIEDSGIPCGIATLNPDWMKDGKADIDGVLAAGVAHELYRECVLQNITPKAYRSAWKFQPAHRSLVERRIEKFFYNGPIEEKFHSYFTKGPKGVDNKISNFVIKVIHTLYDQSGHAVRLCKFVSNYGNSRAVKITPDVMASKISFQKFCYENGDYEFKGNDNDIANIWNYIFMHQDGRTVVVLRNYGHDDPSGIWFFSNGAYINGRIYDVDEDGIVWVEDIGYKLPETMEQLDPPTLSKSESVKVTILDILKNMSSALGESNAKLILGWTLGNFFMPDIIRTWSIYPFLFLYGKQAGGKSTIANWISSFFGFTQKGINFHSSSIAGLSRITSQMSMIPVWLEEYRNKDDQDIAKKNNFLRGIYDKSTIVKGTKKEDEIKTYRPRATLVISGEEHPRDAALNSRCIMIPVFREPKESSAAEESYDWLQRNKGVFNVIGHQLLMNKEENWKKIKEHVDEYLQAFREGDAIVADRTKIQMSIMAGIVDALVEQNEQFTQFISDTADTQENRILNNQALFVFYDDVYHMASSGALKVRVIEQAQTETGPVVKFWFSMAYAEWERQLKGLRNDLPASKAALAEHLRRESYFVEGRQLRVYDKPCYGIVLNPCDPKFPDVLRLMIQSQESNTVSELFNRQP